MFKSRVISQMALEEVLGRASARRSKIEHTPAAGSRVDQGHEHSCSPTKAPEIPNSKSENWEEKLKETGGNLEEDLWDCNRHAAWQVRDQIEATLRVPAVPRWRNTQLDRHWGRHIQTGVASDRDLHRCWLRVEDQPLAAMEHQAQSASDQRPKRGFHHRSPQPERQRQFEQDASEGVREPEGANSRIQFRVRQGPVQESAAQIQLLVQDQKLHRYSGPIWRHVSEPVVDIAVKCVSEYLQAKVVQDRHLLRLGAEASELVPAPLRCSGRLRADFNLPGTDKNAGIHLSKNPGAPDWRADHAAATPSDDGHARRSEQLQDQDVQEHGINRTVQVRCELPIRPRPTRVAQS